MTTPLEAPAETSRGPMPDTMAIAPWPDPVIDRLGHDPRSHYVEYYWLGVVGPSTVWFLRRLADRLDAEPDGFDLHLSDTAAALGLGMKGGRHGPFARAINRACQFGLARRHGDISLEVRRRLPPVTQGQLARLPEHIRRAHDAWQRRQLRQADADAQGRARQLALTLLQLGEDIDATERQLATWRVDDTVASEAVRWAHDRHAAALAASISGPEAA